MPWRAGTGIGASAGTAVTEIAQTDPKSGHHGGIRSKSYAEGTLRELLKTAEPLGASFLSGHADQKGKGIEHVL